MNIAYAASACVSSNTERSSGVGGGLRCLNTHIGHVGRVLDLPASVTNITVKDNVDKPTSELLST